MVPEVELRTETTPSSSGMEHPSHEWGGTTIFPMIPPLLPDDGTIYPSMLWTFD